MRDGMHQRLMKMGFQSYGAYLSSEFWVEAKRRWRQAGLPRQCAVCGSNAYQLHHITYERLGREKPGDLLPLCHDHHRAVHAAERDRAPGSSALTIRQVVAATTGWNSAQVTAALKPYRLSVVKELSFRPKSKDIVRKRKVRRNTQIKKYRKRSK